MNNLYKQTLLKKYEAFELSEKPELKKLLKIEILNILQALPSPDSEDFYIWGLTHYMSEDDLVNHLNLALKKFLVSYQMNTDNFLACLYIAHCYQDLGELEQALHYYQLVDQKALKEFQVWRFVKLIEQIGFCHYQLGDEKLGRAQFQEVLRWYKELDAEDRAVPKEMLQCLPASDELVIEIKKLEDYLI